MIQRIYTNARHLFLEAYMRFPPNYYEEFSRENEELCDFLV